MISKRQRRRLRGKLRTSIKWISADLGRRAGPNRRVMSKDEIGAMWGHPLVRYSLSELLEGSEAIRQLNDDVAWSRDGGPVGRETS